MLTLKMRLLTRIMMHNTRWRRPGKAGVNGSVVGLVTGRNSCEWGMGIRVLWESNLRVPGRSKMGCDLENVGSVCCVSSHLETSLLCMILLYDIHDLICLLCLVNRPRSDLDPRGGSHDGV